MIISPVNNAVRIYPFNPFPLDKATDIVALLMYVNKRIVINFICRNNPSANLYNELAFVSVIFTG